MVYFNLNLTSHESRFSNNIAAGGVELIALGEFDSVISIDRDRRVFNDASV
jgi:hypothetical protein